MKNDKNSFSYSAAAFSALVLTGSPAMAATVWNVNIGNNIDGYQGAAPENTPASTWNLLSSATPSGILDDSTGDNSAGVSVAIISNTGSSNGFNNTNLTTGDDIFVGWTKSSDNSTPFTLTFENLDQSATYDLVIYSDWFWENGSSGLPVNQTAGSGLGGSPIFVNRSTANSGNGLVGPLLQDVNPANVDGGKTNWYRITGLTADGANELSFDMGGINGPLSGFQLIDTAPVPEPSSIALLGLGSLALLRRRR